MTVCGAATGYEVTGTVANLPNGQVKLVAEGERGELEAFREGVRNSGLKRFIQDEQVSWSEASGEYRGFEMVRM